MSIKIGKYDFDDPIDDKDDLLSESGVYVVLKRSPGPLDTNRYIYIGQTGDVHHRVTNNHEHEDCWHKHGRHAGLSFAVLYVNEVKRKKIERELLKLYDPLCGER